MGKQIKLSSTRSPTTLENLPNEVLSEIFIRLLAKQLAQMRCVSKSWNAFLSDSSFVKSHLHHSIQNKDHILLFFGMRCSLDWHTISARSSRSPDLELTNFIKYPVNPQLGYTYSSVIGSVHGLICFSYESYNGDDVVTIWNPSLSAVFTLPPCSWPSRQLYFAFGFDPKTDDYKVVRLRSFSPACNTVPQGEVYSMRKGYWQSISQRFPSHFKRYFVENHVCVDGHLYWIGYTDYEYNLETIVGFDLGAVTFREIPLPDSLLHHHGSQSHSLGVLDGKLCVISSAKHVECEVWVMDECGVAESWVKKYAFPLFSDDITPYRFASHNELLFIYNSNRDRFALYNPITAKTKNFKIIDWLYSTSKFVDYVDSLVWIAPAN